jgi:probable HAF family extracellular repeat protein
VLWQDGVASGLGFLPGDIVSIAASINNNGQVTGQSCDSNTCRGFLWRDGVMTDLNTLVPDSTLDLFDPTGINARGQIVGLGVQKSTGLLRGFLLTPTNTEVMDESATATPLGSNSESSKVIIPEIVRRALRHRLGSRNHIPGVAADRD